MALARQCNFNKKFIPFTKDEYEFEIAKAKDRKSVAKSARLLHALFNKSDQNNQTAKLPKELFGKIATQTAINNTLTDNEAKIIFNDNFIAPPLKK